MTHPNFAFETYPQNALSITCQTCSSGLYRLQISAPKNIYADRLSLRLHFRPEEPAAWKECREHFHFIPSIKQSPENLCGSHAFRAPVVILSDSKLWLALIPDPASLPGRHEEDMFLDMRFDEKDEKPPFAEFGLVKHSPRGHVYYAPTGEPISQEAGECFSCYLLELRGSSREEALFETQKLILQLFSAPYRSSPLPQTADFDTYAREANRFGQTLWREDSSGGGIVLSTFIHPNGKIGGREYPDDLWFHCWFNNMRTARELYFFGKRQNNPEWISMARRIKELLLSAPMRGGLFPTIYAPSEGGWISSSRHGGGPGYFSIPDCAWTAYQLMKFDAECERDERTDAFLASFAAGLLSLVREDGCFPVWISNGGIGEGDKRLFESSPVVGKPPEARLEGSTASAMAAWFLAEWAARSGDAACLEAAEVCMDRLIERHFESGRFEDFELYYSCAAKDEDFFDPISSLPGQSTLAMQWCAGACLAIYRSNGKKQYLRAGRFCIDLLSLYQQVWNPPFLSIYAYGGFGVMNTDGEWNDARQAQFAETLADYYDITGEEVYSVRAIAALRASFTLMAIPENAGVSPMTAADEAYLSANRGASPENHGHSGYDTREGQSGFHWGSGSALVSAASFLRRYGDTIDPLHHK